IGEDFAEPGDIDIGWLADVEKDDTDLYAEINRLVGTAVNIPANHPSIPLAREQLDDIFTWYSTPKTSVRRKSAEPILKLKLRQFLDTLPEPTLYALVEDEDSLVQLWDLAISLGFADDPILTGIVERKVMEHVGYRDLYRDYLNTLVFMKGKVEHMRRMREIGITDIDAKNDNYTADPQKLKDLDLPVRRNARGELEIDWKSVNWDGVIPRVFDMDRIYDLSDIPYNEVIYYIYAGIMQSSLGFTYSATDVVTEERINDYLDILVEAGIAEMILGKRGTPARQEMVNMIQRYRDGTMSEPWSEVDAIFAARLGESAVLLTDHFVEVLGTISVDDPEYWENFETALLTRSDTRGMGILQDPVKSWLRGNLNEERLGALRWIFSDFLNPTMVQRARDDQPRFVRLLIRKLAKLSIFGINGIRLAEVRAKRAQDMKSLIDQIEAYGARHNLSGEKLVDDYFTKVYKGPKEEKILFKMLARSYFKGASQRRPFELKKRLNVDRSFLVLLEYGIGMAARSGTSGVYMRSQFEGDPSRGVKGDIELFNELITDPAYKDANGEVDVVKALEDFWKTHKEPVFGKIGLLDIDTIRWLGKKNRFGKKVNQAAIIDFVGEYLGGNDKALQQIENVTSEKDFSRASPPVPVEAVHKRGYEREYASGGVLMDFNYYYLDPRGLTDPIIADIADKVYAKTPAGDVLPLSAYDPGYISFL
ncbi:MAG: hypothetical protein ACE5JK_07785, partial [Candidatus Omnitrophota bacterium]